MRIVAQQWMTANALASTPRGEQPIFDTVATADDQASMAHNAAFVPTVSTVLLGRRSYESFVQFWPEADLPIAVHVNTVEKIVFSRSLDSAPWGTHRPARVERDAVAWARAARAGDDGVALLWGSLDLMGQLAAAGQLDEIELLVAPTVLAEGIAILPRGLDLRLQLLDVERWGDVVRLRYAVPSD